MQGGDRLSIRQPQPGAVPGQWGDGAGVQVLWIGLYDREESQIHIAYL